MRVTMQNPILHRRTLSNIILFLSIIVLAAIIQLQPKEKAPTRLIPLNKDAINSIIIQTPGQRAVHIQRRNTTWFVEQPYAGAANFRRIDKLLAILATDTVKPHQALPAEAFDTFVNPARAKLRLNDFEILFGEQDAIDQQRYILSQGQLYLIDDIFFSLLNANSGHWANTRILPEKSIAALRLPNFSVVRSESNIWRLLPQNQTLSNTSLQAWLHRWQEAQAVYVEYDPETIVDGQTLAIAFTDDSNLIYTLTSDINNAQLYRHDNGLLYHISPNLLTQLLDTP